MDSYQLVSVQGKANSCFETDINVEQSAACKTTGTFHRRFNFQKKQETHHGPEQWINSSSKIYITDENSSGLPQHNDEQTESDPGQQVSGHGIDDSAPCRNQHSVSARGDHRVLESSYLQRQEQIVEHTAGHHAKWMPAAHEQAAFCLPAMRNNESEATGDEARLGVTEANDGLKDVDTKQELLQESTGDRRYGLNNSQMGDQEMNETPITVSLDEACLGLVKTISYLESHPAIGGDYLPDLRQLLKLIDGHRRKMASESAAKQLDVEKSSLRPAETLKETIRRGKVQDRYSQTDGNAVVSTASSDISDTFGVSIGQSRVSKKQLEHKHSGGRRKSRRTKYNTSKTYTEQMSDEEDDYNDTNDDDEMLEEDEDEKSASSDELPESRSPECKQATQSEDDSGAGKRSTQSGDPDGCGACRKPLEGPPELEGHPAARRAKEKPFKCETCGKSFRRRGYVRQHEMLHTGERPFPCPACDKAFRSAGELRQHRAVHAGVKPHRCDTCGASFAHAAGLRSHGRTHTGDRPFACPICGAPMAHAGSLRVHVMRAHTGERPFVCASCGKAFATGADLRTHQKTHTGERPYACAVCARRFLQAGQLKTHMRTHTGEKPYLCTTCGRGFAHTSSLAVHTRGHTGERPYRCTLCDVRCTDSANLKKHMRLHGCESRCVLGRRAAPAPNLDDRTPK